MKIEITKKQMPNVFKTDISRFSMRLKLILDEADYEALKLYNLDKLTVMEATFLHRFLMRSAYFVISFLIAGFFLFMYISISSETNYRGVTNFTGGALGLLFWFFVPLIVASYAINYFNSPNYTIKDLIFGLNITCSKIGDIAEIEKKAVDASCSIKRLVDECKYWGDIETVTTTRDTSEDDINTSTKEFSTDRFKYKVVWNRKGLHD